MSLTVRYFPGISSAVDRSGRQLNETLGVRVKRDFFKAGLQSEGHSRPLLEKKTTKN